MYATSMTKKEKIKFLQSLVKDPDMLGHARQSIEDHLIEFRDRRISQPFRGNGLVVREPNGKPSDIIRLGTEDAVRIGLLAIIEKLNG